MTEPIARVLSRKYPDFESLETTLIETSRRPLYERTFANYFANPGSRIDSEKSPFSKYEKRIQRTEDAALTDIPVWYAVPEWCAGDKMMTVPVMQPGMTAMIITGDAARNKVQISPNPSKQFHHKLQKSA